MEFYSTASYMLEFLTIEQLAKYLEVTPKEVTDWSKYKNAPSNYKELIYKMDAHEMWKDWF